MVSLLAWLVPGIALAQEHESSIPAGGTFSTANTVGLALEFTILTVLAATFVCGVALLGSLKPPNDGAE